MKNLKKKLLILLSSCAFALMMVFNVSVSMEGESVGTDVSLSGIEAIANSTQESGNNCYLNARQTGDGQTCFVCTTTKSDMVCASDCGSEVCW